LGARSRRRQGSILPTHPLPGVERLERCQAALPRTQLPWGQRKAWPSRGHQSSTTDAPTLRNDSLRSAPTPAVNEPLRYRSPGPLIPIDMPVDDLYVPTAPRPTQPAATGSRAWYDERRESRFCLKACLQSASGRLRLSACCWGQGRRWLGLWAIISRGRPVGRRSGFRSAVGGTIVLRLGGRCVWSLWLCGQSSGVRRGSGLPRGRRR
jgi:hypothetical protein